MNFIKNHQTSFLILLLLFIYVFEGYSKIIYISTGNNSSIPKIIKGLGMAFMLLQLSTLPKISLELKSLFVLVCCFIIGQLSTLNGLTTENTVFFLKYTFSLVCFLYVSKYPVKKKVIFRVFEMIILINSGLIIIGVIFSIQYFQTYSGIRFGYNGLFYSSSLSSYVYVIALFYWLKKEKDRIWFNWEAIVVLVSACFIGTKTIYFSMAIICLYYIYFFIKNKYKNILIGITLIIAAFLFYFVFFKYGIFSEIRKTKGILSSLLSYRNELLVNETLPYIKENWSFFNYCFGGVKDFTTKSEMGFFDLVYFFGIVGAGIFIWLYYKTFFNFKKDLLSKFFLSLFFFIIFFTGNFFVYTSIPIFLLVLRERFKENQNKEFQKVSDLLKN